MDRSLKSFLKLNESILDPFVEDLSPDLWDKNQKLKKSVSVHITKKLETWLKGFTEKEPSKIYLMGSMTGYQYTDTSDIDVNFVVDITDKEKIKEMRGLLPNNQMLPGTKHPINYYMTGEVKEDWKKSGPIYDVLKDKWKSPPSKSKNVAEGAIIGSYRVVIEISRFFLAGLDSVLTEYNADVAAYEEYEKFLKITTKPEDIEDLKELIKFKLDEVISDIDGIRLGHHMLRSLREEAFVNEKGFEISTQITITDTNANASINNMVYKFCERLGYLEKMQKIVDTKEKWLEKRNAM
jgi:hypothetical protein